MVYKWTEGWTLARWAEDDRKFGTVNMTINKLFAASAENLKKVLIRGYLAFQKYHFHLGFLKVGYFTGLGSKPKTPNNNVPELNCKACIGNPNSTIIKKHLPWLYCL